MRDCPEDCPKQGTYHEHERSVNCRGPAANCFGYHGRYDLHTCLAAARPPVPAHRAPWPA